MKPGATPPAMPSHSDEAGWNTGEWGPGHKIGYKGGYFPVAPFDGLQDIRSEMVNEMIKAGLKIERHHHEVATAGQTEIDLRFAPMIQMADWMQIYKYIVKNVAAKHGKTATFMPKPLFEDNGSGMHVHSEPVEGRQAAVCRRQVCRPEPDGAVVHRRHSDAHQLAAGHLCADDELLPPPGAWL